MLVAFWLNIRLVLGKVLTKLASVAPPSTKVKGIFVCTRLTLAVMPKKRVIIVPYLKQL